MAEGNKRDVALVMSCGSLRCDLSALNPNTAANVTAAFSSDGMCY